MGVIQLSLRKLTKYEQWCMINKLYQIINNPCHRVYLLLFKNYFIWDGGQGPGVWHHIIILHMQRLSLAGGQTCGCSLNFVHTTLILLHGLCLEAVLGADFGKSPPWEQASLYQYTAAVDDMYVYVCMYICMYICIFVYMSSPMSFYRQKIHI